MSSIEERAEKIAHDLAMYRHASEIARWVEDAMRLREAHSGAAAVHEKGCEWPEASDHCWCKWDRAIAAHDKLVKQYE